RRIRVAVLSVAAGRGLGRLPPGGQLLGRELAHPHFRLPPPQAEKTFARGALHDDLHFVPGRLELFQGFGHGLFHGASVRANPFRSHAATPPPSPVPGGVRTLEQLLRQCPSIYIQATPTSPGTRCEEGNARRCRPRRPAGTACAGDAARAGIAANPTKHIGLTTYHAVNG